MVKSLFVTLWFALIALPVVQALSPFIWEPPIRENRVLAQFPTISVEHPIAGAKGIVAWFNDNFGFRLTLIRVRTEWNYAFGYSDRIHIGPDGWLNYRGVLDDQKGLNATLTKQQIAAIADRFTTLQQYLTKRSVRLLVVSVPQKDVIYPESLPADAPVYPSPSAFERLRALLTERLGQDHIDAEPILMHLKAEGIPAFYRTDFHWTTVAGGEVARAVVNRIADLEHKPDLRWTEPLPVTHIAMIGGESIELPIFDPFSEQTISVDVDWRNAREGAFQWTNADAHFQDRYPLNYSFVWRSTRSDGLPPTAFCTNSYGEAFWYAGTQFHFSKLETFRVAPPDITLTSAIQHLGPDTKYFVLQFNETVVPVAAEVDWDKL
jgi:hypothetical protein